MNSLKKPSYLEELPSSTDFEKILLCAHGLNQNPSALKILLEDLTKLGFKTYLLHLPGHFGEMDYSSLKAKDYYEAHKSSYDYLVQKYNQPIYFLGYSFGGLIGVHHFDHCPFEKMILLAPAIKLHGYTTLLKAVVPYLSRIKSIALGSDEVEARYRYHNNGVPAEIYSSFFTIYSQNKFKDKSLAKKSEALVMIHPRDELVSSWKLRRWVTKKTRWKFKTLDNKEAPFRRYNHLCFDPMTLGVDSYNTLLKDIKEFL